MMSSTRVKTTYDVEGPWGSTESRTLYCVINNSCDVTSFYDENGIFILSIDDRKPNIIDAMIKLRFPHNMDGKLREGVQHLLHEEYKNKIITPSVGERLSADFIAYLDLIERLEETTRVLDPQLHPWTAKAYKAILRAWVDHIPQLEARVLENEEEILSLTKDK